MGWGGQPGSQCSDLAEKGLRHLRAGKDGEDRGVAGLMDCDRSVVSSGEKGIGFWL